MNGPSGQVAGRRPGHAGQPAWTRLLSGVILTEWVTVSREGFRTQRTRMFVTIPAVITRR